MGPGPGRRVLISTVLGFTVTFFQSLSATADCGNNTLEVGEECDDGNTEDTDGCTSQCQLGPVCSAVSPALFGGDRFATDPATGACYVSFDDEQLTFSDASAVCVNRGGHLATITSAGEQTLVDSVRDPAQFSWIGATDELVEGSFAWVTGESFFFEFWGPGQPDGGGGVTEEDCVATSSSGAGEWIDTSCSFVGFVNGYLCELEPLTPTPSATPTPSPSATPSATATPTGTATPTSVPSATPTGTPATAPLDLDGDGATAYSSDGVLLMRVLFGFRGTVVTDDAVRTDCKRCDAEEIIDHVEGLALVFDIDDDKHVEPLSDGLLALRYLFGFSGPALVSGAVSPQCTRCEPSPIFNYLQTID